MIILYIVITTIYLKMVGKEALHYLTRDTRKAFGQCIAMDRALLRIFALMTLVVVGSGGQIGGCGVGLAILATGQLDQWPPTCSRPTPMLRASSENGLRGPTTSFLRCMAMYRPIQSHSVVLYPAAASGDERGYRCRSGASRVYHPRPRLTLRWMDCVTAMTSAT